MDKNDIFSSNVYKISIQARVDSAIINKGVHVRSKTDGDAYVYGGINRKVKKLFIDKKIPLGKRALYPIICDEKGIVWVPGFGVRDDARCDKDGVWITLYTNNK